jgi:hypothetical protein
VKETHLEMVVQAKAQNRGPFCKEIGADVVVDIEE